MNTALPPSETNPFPFLPKIRSPRERLSDRTHELALRAGRNAIEITQADYERAKREITGETQRERQDTILNRDASPAPPIGNNWKPDDATK